MSDKKIIIIGAGISGLICALELEKKGYSPVILEGKASAGGRLQTDYYESIPLDHGFQVLLTEYPYAKKYLNYDALNLRYFKPGAVISDGNDMVSFGDPIRDKSFLISTTFTSMATFSDKLKVNKLAKDLKEKSIEDIFNSEEISTLDYLRQKGFSGTIIKNFFKPFFSGIFLEDKLATSSRMFEFVYKMFATGHAAVPNNGIQEIANQLVSKLNNTAIHYNTKVESIEDGIVKTNSDEFDFDKVVIATVPDGIIDYPDRIRWKDCYNLYFKIKKSGLKKPIIGLVNDESSSINNFHFVTDIHDINSDYAVLSVTVVKDVDMSEDELIKQATQDAEKYCNVEFPSFIKMFHIKKALPDISDIKYEPVDEKIKYSENIYLAGDHLAMGSLNAAMASGNKVAKLIAEELSDN